MMQTSHHTSSACSALCAYLTACSFSLLFCIVKSASSQAAAGSETTLGSQKSGSAVTQNTSTNTNGALGVLEVLLQTQLGVFVFSNFIIACCAAIAAITTSVFLESLTPTEAGRLTQRLLKYLLFKVALVGMVVLPSEVQLLHWLPWLAVIGEMKMFVGLAKDRLAGLSPAVGISRHVRTLCLLLMILTANVLGVALLRKQKSGLSWAISLLFGLDLGVIIVDAAKAVLSCVSLLMDEALAVSSGSLDVPTSLLGRAVTMWEGWQSRGREQFFYHTELLADVAVHLLTLLHHGHVWLLHGISFHLLDALLLLDTRAVVLSFLQRVKAHMLHRAATLNLDSTFPDATAKQLLAEEADCSICRDRLAAAKQLPCGHLFHLSCLRAWLQQCSSDNFKCPICRMTLCVKSAQSSTTGQAAALGAAGGQEQQQRRMQWRLPAQASGGLMGSFSLSMSLDDLSLAQRNGTHGAILEEQLLLATDDGALAGEDMLADAATQRLLAEASLETVGSDADNFEAMLAQALAASLQTANESGPAIEPSDEQAQEMHDVPAEQHDQEQQHEEQPNQLGSMDSRHCCSHHDHTQQQQHANSSRQQHQSWPSQQVPQTSPQQLQQQNTSGAASTDAACTTAQQMQQALSVGSRSVAAAGSVPQKGHSSSSSSLPPVIPLRPSYLQQGASGSNSLSSPSSSSCGQHTSGAHHQQTGEASSSLDPFGSWVASRSNNDGMSCMAAACGEAEQSATDKAVDGGGSPLAEPGLLPAAALPADVDAAAAWSDPLSDSDVLPLGCSSSFKAAHSVRKTCRRVLASIISSSSQQAAGKSAQGDSGTLHHSCRGSSSSSSSGRADVCRRRRSRSCGHLTLSELQRTEPITHLTGGGSCSRRGRWHERDQWPRHGNRNQQQQALVCVAAMLSSSETSLARAAAAVAKDVDNKMMSILPASSAPALCHHYKGMMPAAAPPAPGGSSMTANTAAAAADADASIDADVNAMSWITSSAPPTVQVAVVEAYACADAPTTAPGAPGAPGATEAEGEADGVASVLSSSAVERLLLMPRDPLRRRQGGRWGRRRVVLSD